MIYEWSWNRVFENDICRPVDASEYGPGVYIISPDGKRLSDGLHVARFDETTGEADLFVTDHKGMWVVENDGIKRRRVTWPGARLVKRSENA